MPSPDPSSPPAEGASPAAPRLAAARARAAQDAFCIECFPFMSAAVATARLTGDDATEAESEIVVDLLQRLPTFDPLDADGPSREDFIRERCHRVLAGSRTRDRAARATADCQEVEEQRARGPELASVVEARDLVAKLMPRFETLAEGQLAALLAHDVEGDTMAEVAKAQGVPLGTVQSRVAKAREVGREAVAAVERGEKVGEAGAGEGGKGGKGDGEANADGEGKGERSSGEKAKKARKKAARLKAEERKRAKARRLTLALSLAAVVAVVLVALGIVNQVAPQAFHREKKPMVRYTMTSDPLAPPPPPVNR